MALYEKKVSSVQDMIREPSKNPFFGVFSHRRALFFALFLLILLSSFLCILKVSYLPIHWAAEGNWTNLARIFLALGANVDSENQFQETPLIVSIKNKNDDMAILLIENGASLEFKNPKSGTPIHYAVAYNRGCDLLGMSDFVL